MLHTGRLKLHSGIPSLKSHRRTLKAPASQDKTLKSIINFLARSATEAAASAGEAHKAEPFGDATRSEAYRPSVISYFDILGFKELLSSAGEDANRVGDVLDLARKFSEPDEGAVDNFGWRSINFSDLIVRAVPILTETNRKVRVGLVFQELTDIAHIQLNLAFKGILIRGAVTVGQILIKSDLVFGPGLVDAYILESTKAIAPRVIIDNKIFSALKQIALLRSHPLEEEMQYIRPLISKDTDGLWFVDYLNYAKDNADDNHEYALVLQKHRELVATQLAESYAINGRTRLGKSRRHKAEWLKSYHNKHVKTLSAASLKSETGIQRRSLLV
jgi:hypothetical protein